MSSLSLSLSEDGEREREPVAEYILLVSDLSRNPNV
jgi:hypothetical protein